MELPTHEGKTEDQYWKELFNLYKAEFGEPPPMMIIDDISEIEDAIKTGKRITAKSKGWNGQGTFY